MNTTSPSRPTPSYWVRSYDPDTMTYTLVPVLGEGRALKVKVDRDGNKQDVVKAMKTALDHSDRGGEPVKCILRKDPKGGGFDPGDTDGGAHDFILHDVVPGGLSQDRDGRKMLGKGGEVVSHWTPDLDRAVFQHAEYKTYHAAMEQQKLLMEDQVFFNDVRSQAMEALRRGLGPKTDAAGHKVARSDRDIMDILPANFQDAFQGREGDAKVRYDTRCSFAEQEGMNPSGVAREARMANYAMQKAIVKNLVDISASQVPNRDGTLTSLAQSAQNDLVGDETLLAGHPSKEDEDFRLESRETATLMGAAALAGVMAMNGAEPSDPDHNPLMSRDPVTGQEMARFPIHREIMAELKARKCDTLPPNERLQAYLHMGSDRLAQYLQAAKRRVFNIQTKVAVKGANKPRPPSDRAPAPQPQPKPPSIASTLNKEGLAAAGSIASGVDTAIKDIASIPFPGLQ